MSIQRNLKKITIPIYTLKVPVSQNNTFPVQFRIKTEDGSKISAWSNIYEVAGPTVDGGDTLTLKLKNNKVNITWEDDNNRVLYDVFVHRFADISVTSSKTALKSRPTSTTGRIVLYNSTEGNQSDATRLPHQLKVGMRIILSSGWGADYATTDTYVTAVPNPYTFEFSPTPTTTVATTPEVENNATISIHASTPDVITDVENYDFVFAGNTDKNSFSVQKGNVVSTTPAGTSVTLTATDIWCLVQAASSNRQANELLDIATAHIAL